MGTFFAEVIRDNADDEEDPTVLWIGGDFGQVTSIEAIAAPLAPYLILTEELIRTLRGDCIADLDRRPTDLQRQNLTFAANAFK